MINAPKMTVEYLGQMITQDATNGELWEQYKWSFADQFSFPDRYITTRRGKYTDENSRRFTMLEFLQYLDRSSKLTDFYISFERAKKEVTPNPYR